MDLHQLNKSLSHRYPSTQQLKREGIQTLHPSASGTGSRISRPISDHDLINELCLKTADS